MWMNEWVVLPKLHECTIYTSMKAVAGGNIGCQRLNRDNRHRKWRKPPPSAVVRRVRGIDDDKDSGEVRLWDRWVVGSIGCFEQIQSEFSELKFVGQRGLTVELISGFVEMKSWRSGTVLGCRWRHLWWPLPVGTFSFTQSSILGKRVVDVKKAAK